MQPVFELRTDPIVGRQVLIAENRAGRPYEFADRSQPDETESADHCPFCAGHEKDTPKATLEVSAETGPWQVRVVPNKYPAVSMEEQETSVRSHSSLESISQLPFGAHEVVIESPLHLRDVTELSQDELARVFRVYRQRLRDWSFNRGIEYVSIFKNLGVAAGASLAHVHSQVVALPAVPPIVADELRCAESYWAECGECIFCNLIDDELSRGERVVVATELMVAFCAFAGRQPYETWIMPREHQARFEEATDEALFDLAGVIQLLVRRLQTQLSPLSYNMILHTAPYRMSTDAFYHWHFELIPRSTQLAGFEWGTGVHINPLAPERAAQLLATGG